MPSQDAPPKNYVHTQTAPLVDKTNNLKTAPLRTIATFTTWTRVLPPAFRMLRTPLTAPARMRRTRSRPAGQADTAANDAVHRADTLDSVVAGLDNYHSVAGATVNFGFDKAVLTKDDKDQLDSFAAQLGSAKSYILEVTGGTDSVGSAQYNYELSNRRADAVVQYLAAKYNVPAHKFYLIGIGKDKEVASNSTAEGRHKNRRVEIRLLTNMGGSDMQSTQPAPSGSR